MILEHYGILTAPFACLPPRNSTSQPSLDINAATSIASSPHCNALQSFPLFVKPCTVSSGIGITQTNKVMNPESLQAVVDDLSMRYPSQPILIERFLVGREFTVGIVGTGSEARVLGVRELVYLKHHPDHPIDPSVPYDTYDPALLQLDIYGQELKRNWSPNPQYKDLSVEADPVVKAVADVALKAWNVLGCRDGGRIDIRHDMVGPEAIPNVIEVSHCFPDFFFLLGFDKYNRQVNPIAGLRPNWSDLPQLAKAHGVSYDELVGLIISSAMKRGGLNIKPK
jgi:D-alanine-D-alanine ligase